MLTISIGANTSFKGAAAMFGTRVARDSRFFAKNAGTMKENYFAKTRNGHLLRDTFDKNTRTLDIYSSGLYPSNVLSNLAYKPFTYDGVECASIEGFLQSLKTDNITEQKRLCSLYGGNARKNGSKYNEWQQTQKLFWQGKEYKRESDEYFDLVQGAYRECFKQNKMFQKALKCTKNINLTHKAGKKDKTKTVLTEEEFINILTGLRDKK